MFAFKTKPLAGYVHLAKNSVDAKKMHETQHFLYRRNNKCKTKVIGTVSQFWMQIGLPFAIKAVKVQKNAKEHMAIQDDPGGTPKLQDQVLQSPT